MKFRFCFSNYAAFLQHFLAGGPVRHLGQLLLPGSLSFLPLNKVTYMMTASGADCIIFFDSLESFQVPNCLFDSYAFANLPSHRGHVIFYSEFT